MRGMAVVGWRNRGRRRSTRIHLVTSPRLHHLIQGRSDCDCVYIAGDLELAKPLLWQVAVVAMKFKLTEAATLWAGLANSYSAVGSLRPSKPDLRWDDICVRRLLLDRETALTFLAGEGPCTRAFGMDNIYELEFLVAPQLSRINRHVR